MRIGFRTDASMQIGTGHVMRCLALADALKVHGVMCVFVCRQHLGHLSRLIEEHGHEVAVLPELDRGWVGNDSNEHASWLGTDWATDAADTMKALANQRLDWLVVDHYALDARWEQAVRPVCRNLMVIDDLADRTHRGDLLLDQNLGRRIQDYETYIAPTTIRLIGPKYALLRPEFAEHRTNSLLRRSKQLQIEKILITMGGGSG